MLCKKGALMFDDLSAFFQENVVSAYVSYIEIRNNRSYGISKDIRSGISAASALFHLREHLSPTQQMSRAAVARACPDYDILGDIVNASKHRELTRGTPQISKAENISETVIITEYEDSEGLYIDAEKLVMVKLDNGTERDLLDILTNAINYWGCKFVQLGYLNSFKPFVPPKQPGSDFVVRSDAKNLDIEILRGVRFKQNMQLLKYDSQLGFAAPVDLTGCEAQFRIYKPSYTIDIKLSHPTTGDDYLFSLELSESQSMEWHTLQSNEEREKFMKRLSEERSDEIQQSLDEEIKRRNLNLTESRQQET